jgi:division protein CdvB (Snf7/Vps24/ESCRT-III family)
MNKEVTKMLCEFDKENMKNEMMQETTGDAIDGALNQESNEEEEKRIVSEVLDEIRVSLDSEIPEAPLGKKVEEEASVNIAKPEVLVTGSTAE